MGSLRKMAQQSFYWLQLHREGKFQEVQLIDIREILLEKKINDTHKNMHTAQL